MLKRKSVEERVVGELLKSIVTADVNIVNQTAADDSSVEERMRVRVGSVGNKCRGDISRALQRGYDTGLEPTAGAIANKMLKI